MGYNSKRDVGIVAAKSADLTAKSPGSRVHTAEAGTEATAADRRCRTEGCGRTPICPPGSDTGRLAAGACVKVGLAA